ncbi:MAG: transcriptional repressor [Eubacteriales bacterium]|nr:transcriptional repressor [Eubacteriales bacterium]
MKMNSNFKRKEIAMSQVRSYDSRPKRLVIETLKDLSSEFVTAEELYTELLNRGRRVGMTTVYRNLNRLVDKGLVVKVVSANNKGTRFRYIAESDSPSPYGKLECSECGEVQKLSCEELDKLVSHIEANHNFTVSRPSTIFYGLCEDCEEHNPAEETVQTAEAAGDFADTEQAERN